MNTLVRKAKKIDRKACISLLQELYPHLSPESLEEKFFWGEEQAFVLLADGKVVGLIIWEWYEDLPDGSCLLDLAAIVIDGKNRLQSFGRQLYETSLALMRREVDVAGVHVLTTSTREAMGFFETVMPISRRSQTAPLPIRGKWYVSLLCECEV